MSSSIDTRPQAVGDTTRVTTRLAGLDGLRAVAVAAVVVFHFAPNWLPGGFLGVDLFFVISGYLITRLLLAEVASTGRLAIGAFYLRRIRRLVPAVVVLLAAVSAGSLLLWRDELPSLWGTVVASLGYGTNWWFIADHQSYFVSTGRPPMLQHLWSLAIEEQFYLVWPWVLAVITRATLVRRRTVTSSLARNGRGSVSDLVTERVARIALIGAGASTGLMAVLAILEDIPFSTDSTRVYFGTDTHAMGLLLGAMMAALAMRGSSTGLRGGSVPVRGSHASPRRRLSPAVTDLVGLLALAGFVVIVATVAEFNVGLYRGGFLAVSAVCALAVAAAPRPGSRFGAALDWAPLRWVGTRSYGIYLWHWPVTVAFRPGFETSQPLAVVFAIRLAITLVLAEASFRLIERPIRTGGLAGLRDAWRRPNLGADSARLRVVAVWSVAVLATVVAVGLARAPADTAVARSEPIVSRPALPTFSVAAPPIAPRASSKASQASRPKVTAVSAFGDSVMLGAAPSLIASLPHTTVDAVEGRQARDVLADVIARRTAHTLAPVVVIHVGDNGVINAEDLGATLRALRDRQRVVMINDRVSRDWQNPNNAVLSQVTRHFSNVVLIDWFDLSRKHADWFYDDGLHLRGLGAEGYTELIVGAVFGS